MDDNPFGAHYAGGGGFMGGDSSQDGQGRRMGTQSLRPVTVRQVLHASQPHSDAPFTFDGAELSQVSLVAWVRSATKNATNIQYTVDDGTGQIDVRKWIDNSMDEGATVDDIESNQYVRIMGEIKSFNNKRSITAASIHLLQDHNEYLFHQLDVIYTHLALTKASGSTTAPSHTGADVSAYDDAVLHKTDSMAADLSQLTALQRRIYQTIAAEAPECPEGVDLQIVKERCRNVDAAEIQDAVDELANEGYIYQASDDTHYLTTAG
ncbi:Replication factor A protein 2 [Malassezia nana]|uniref:Replication factor A protein 2 n=1 Tax=Malassezia nana TaxID=180528 RepID=A0AAF0EME7_9BASI|nr:Replication factor A protein 2 [Malassezia nana]